MKVGLVRYFYVEPPRKSKEETSRREKETVRERILGKREGSVKEEEVEVTFPSPSSFSLDSMHFRAGQLVFLRRQRPPAYPRKFEYFDFSPFLTLPLVHTHTLTDMAWPSLIHPPRYSRIHSYSPIPCHSFSHAPAAPHPHTHTPTHTHPCS